MKASALLFAIVVLGCITLAALLATSPAHAGPTVAADLDLGTSLRSDPAVISAPTGGYTPGASPTGGNASLYLVGFTLRAGWRFDLPVAFFLVPEIGGGFAVERHTYLVPDGRLGRFFGGGRAGWSAALAPALRLEPAIYGHAGLGAYDAGPVGVACDVGLAVDLRMKQSFLVGAQVGYDVVTRWYSVNGAVLYPQSPSITSVAVADPAIAYGIHAGYLFW